MKQNYKLEFPFIEPFQVLHLLKKQVYKQNYQKV